MLPSQPTDSTMTQILQTLASMGQKNGPLTQATAGTPFSSLAQLAGQSGNASQGNPMGQLQAVSQMFGYHPSTLFGYNMGDQNQPSTGATAGSLPTDSPVTGYGPTSQQTGASSGANGSNEQNNFWSGLWSMFSPSNLGGSQ